MHGHILLQFAIMLAAAKIGGEIFERWLKLPAVLGEILGGAVVGSSVLGLVQANNEILEQFAQIGAVLLLFEVGLESSLEDLFRVGGAALWVACAGVILPFTGGWLTARALGYAAMPSLFLGAALTATSIGITARVFADLRLLQSREAKVVLGAAVADDVIGLIILAAVSGLASAHTVSWPAIGRLTGLAILFLVGAVLLGLWLTPFLLRRAQQMQTRAAVSSVAVIFCLLLATLAEAAQLAPIIGAFAAGLTLARAEQRIHFEEKVKSVADLFVPIFFVMMGARMKLQAFDPLTPAGRSVWLLGLALVVVVTASKLLAGLSTPLRGVDRWLIGVGTIPRGEVSLIVASMGLANGALTESLYAVLVFVVIVTTLITPLLLKFLANRAGLQPTDPPTPEASEPPSNDRMDSFACFARL